MKITRSFSKKIQLRPYEPLESFCAVEYETEDENLDTLTEKSKTLDEFVRKEVEITLNHYKKIDEKKSKDTARDSAELDIDTNE